MTKTAIVLAACLWCWTIVAIAVAAERRPNVLIIIADDMGYGDLGAHGNTIVRTPHLDRFARQSLELAHFYVSPVCAPTRASLLTGRYNYRTGVTDTFMGRAMMRTEETTLAEHLRPAGYQSGIFGKWHLGDCYPLRPIDQGFDEALVHRGGGIGQPSDPPGGSSYFDPMLFHNGKAEKQRGYVSDVITDAAIHFIERHREQPFFAYLAFNAPHVPLEVPESYRALYRQVDSRGYNTSADTIARVYGMVTNIDANIGRLLKKLDELGLASETIVIFLTDNGPQQPRYNAGLRGQKGTVYEGGIRAPFFVRWPGRIKPGKLDAIAAHIDVVPTLLEACRCEARPGAALDGKSLWPLIVGSGVAWPERALFFQWHRGNVPRRYRGFAVRTREWKLLRADRDDSANKPGAEAFELYHVASDPGESKNVAALHADVVERLRNAYDAWFDDVCRWGFDPPRIVLGSDHENPCDLTRQDWRIDANEVGPMNVGRWFVQVAKSGAYRFDIRLETGGTGAVELELNNRRWQAERAAGGAAGVGPVRLDAGPATIRATCEAGDQMVGAYQITVQRLAD